MTDLTNVQPVNQPRRTAVDRRAVNGIYETMPPAGTLASNLPEVSRDVVSHQLARGSTTHPDNVRELSFVELRDEYEAKKAKLPDRPTAPTRTDIFGTTQPPKPSDFHRGRENDATAVDSFMHNGSRYQIGDIAAGIMDNIVMNHRFHGERLDTYREFFTELLASLDVIEGKASGLTKETTKFNKATTELAELERVAKLQYVFEASVTAVERETAAHAADQSLQLAVLHEELAALRSRLDEKEKADAE